MDSFAVLESTLGTRVKPRGRQPKTGGRTPWLAIRPLGSLGGFQKHSRKHYNKWNGVARTPLIKQAIFDTSTLIGFLRIEALQLAQFHILRCFEAGIIVDLDKKKNDDGETSFWYWVYKSIRDLRFNGGLKKTAKHPVELFTSAEQYANAVAAPSLPRTAPGGDRIQWSSNNTTDWRTDCMKADAARIQTNMENMHSFDGYRGKLANVVVQFLIQYFDFPRKIRNSFKVAILRSLHTTEQLSVVVQGFPTLSNIDQGVIQEIQTMVVDAIRPVMSPDFTSITCNLRSVYDLRCLLRETFQNGEQQPVQVVQQNNQQLDFSTLPLWSVPCEALANDINNALQSNPSSKDIMILVRRSLDLMRMANQTLVEADDVGWKKPKNYTSRRPMILKLLTDAVFGGVFVDFTTQSHSKCLSADEKQWCSSTAAEWVFPTTDNEIRPYLQRLEAHVRGLLVRQKVTFAKKSNAKNKPPIKLPSLCPVAKKRAVFIDIPNTAIPKMAKSIKLPKSGSLSVTTAAQAFKTAEELYVPYKPKRKQDDGSSKRKTVEPPQKSEEEVSALKRAHDVAKVEFHEACWSALFKIKRNTAGGVKWRFDARMITDGISVFVQVWRPKTAEELRVEELAKEISVKKKKARDKKVDCGCASKKHVCGKEKNLKAEEDDFLAEQEAELNVALERARKILNTPGHRQPRFFDPGASGHEGIIFDQMAFDTMHLPRGQNKHFERISLRKNVMQSKAGQKARVRKMNEWMGWSEAVSTFNENAPSPLKSSKDLFLNDYCTPTNAALGEVYEFYAQNCIRRLRFDVDSKTRAMLEDAVASICGTNDRKEQKRTVVVFGNAAVNTGKTNHSRICYGALIDLLRRRCCLVTLDEYKSSKLCCCCHEELTGAVVAEGRSSKSWKIRICFNRECHRVYFQRDLNACINICKFFFWRLHGVDFPDEFRRGGRQVVNQEEEIGDDDGDDEYVGI